MTTWLLYWRPDTVKNDDPTRPQWWSGSQWIERDGVKEGDVLWVATSYAAGDLRLVARIPVQRVVHSRAEAVAIVGQHAWANTEHFAFGRKQDGRPLQDINLRDVARRLTFAGGVQRLPKGFDGKHLQRMRKLTEESASLLQRAWAKGAVERPRRLAHTPLESHPASVAQALLQADDDEEFSFPEGREALHLHRARERSRKLVAAKKRASLQKTGRLACEVCAFDFKARYGDLGADFIECHHAIPISSLPAGAKTRLQDVALVCSNCHRMLHRKQPWLQMAELRSLLALQP